MLADRADVLPIRRRSRKETCRPVGKGAWIGIIDGRIVAHYRVLRSVGAEKIAPTSAICSVSVGLTSPFLNAGFE